MLKPLVDTLHLVHMINNYFIRRLYVKFKVVYEYATYIHSYIMYTKLLLIRYYLKLILHAGNFIIIIYYSETTVVFLIPTSIFHSDPSLIASIV